jgi:hypothetical protein
VRINRFSSLRLIATYTRNGRPSASYERYFPMALTSWKPRSTENSDDSTCNSQLSEDVHYRLSLREICATYHQYITERRELPANGSELERLRRAYATFLFTLSRCSDGYREIRGVVCVIFFLGLREGREGSQANPGGHPHVVT